MIKIKAYLGKSKIDGWGVFASEDIKKGTITWEYVDGFDIIVDNYMLNNDPDYIKKYAFFDKQLNKHILCGDIDRYTNHSENPNIGPLPDGRMVALRDIKKDEEIVANYNDIDLYVNQKF